MEHELNTSHEKIRQITLVKGKHRYMFRYSSGSEGEVVYAMAELASDNRTDFDWFDAAVLAYQIGKRMESEVKETERRRI